MVGWKNYIASCLRISDLVESRREPGTAPIFNKTAVGRSDALWLSLGINILEYLNDKAAEVGSEFTSIGPIIEVLLRQYPAINDDDILFVCRVLSTETVFHCPDGEKIVPVGKTALIEQLSTSRQYRLAATGRMVADMANRSSDLVYTDDDARKILKAMDIGDFGRAMRLCRDIRIQLVRFAHDLRRAQERPGGSLLLEEFARHREVFERVVANTQETVSVGLARLRTDEVADQVDAWGEDNDDSLTAPQVRRALKDLAGILERLVRIFAQMVQTLADANRQGGKILDFRALSHMLVHHPPSEKRLHNFIHSIGPCKTTFAYIVPQDMEGCIQLRLAEESAVRLEFDDGREIADTPQWVADLIGHHRAEIVAELGSKGHVSLQTGIARGWFRIEDIEMLSSLTGLFRCPEDLGMGDRVLAVGFGPEFRMNVGNKLFSGDDLALVLVGEVG
jgi:hypothetical protein